MTYFRHLVWPVFLVFFATARDGCAQSGPEAARQVDSLNARAMRSFGRNPDSVRFYADRALARARQFQYTRGQQEARLVLAQFFLHKEEYEKVLDQYFGIIDLYPQEDVPNLVEGYNRVSQYFFTTIKDYELARKYVNIMIRLSATTGDPLTRGRTHLCQAKFHLSQNHCDSAIRFCYLSLPYLHKAGILGEVGDVFKLLGDAFVWKKMYPRAEYNYRQAIAMAARSGNLPVIAILYTRIAHIYQVTGVDNLNLKYNLDALRIRKQTGPPRLISSSLLNVGEAYWLLGRKDSARHYLQESLRLAEEIQSTDQLETIYTQLANFAKAENRYADALKYYRICYDYRTKMFQDRSSSDIRILEANRSIRMSEGQVELLQQETTLQELNIRNRRIQILLFEVALLIMFTLILFTNTMVRKNRKRKNELKVLNDRLTREISTRIEAEGRLRRSEEINRFLAENTADVISLSDAGMKLIYISPSCEKYYGYSDREILQMEGPELIDPQYQATVALKIREIFRTRRSVKTVYPAIRKDGSSFWAETRYNPVTDPATREVQHVITIVRDISERIKYEEELSENSRQKEFLLREIHNRVKNNFAILVSLMNMQCDQSANPELTRSLSDLQLRVRTMSLVHEQLYQSKEISIIPFDNYLRHLTLIISGSFNNRRIVLQTETHPCNVAIEMALPLGLIINELITNAYKYAFPGDRSGNIWVRLHPEADGMFCICVSDDGIGLPDDFTDASNQSMGSQIVHILVRQIEATFQVANNGGAAFRIFFSPIQATRL